MKRSEIRKVEQLTEQFVDALTTNQFGAIAVLLESLPGRVTAESAEMHVEGLTAGSRIENAYFQIVPSLTDMEATVHVCFDVEAESQLVCLTFGSDGSSIHIKDIEWGYPD